MKDKGREAVLCVNHGILKLKVQTASRVEAVFGIISSTDRTGVSGTSDVGSIPT